MTKPSFAEFKKLAKKGNLIPVYKEVLADQVTPVFAFRQLAASGKDYAFLLESVEGGEKIGRYSFVSAGPKIVFEGQGNKIKITENGKREEKTVESPLPELKKILNRYKIAGHEDLPRFWGGAVGYIGYDAVRFFEKLPDTLPDTLKIPDSIFLVNKVILIFDHLRQSLLVVSNAFLDEKNNPEEIYQNCGQEIEQILNLLTRASTKSFDFLPEKNSLVRLPSVAPKESCSQQEFVQAVEKAKKYIHQGDVIQVVISQRWYREVHAPPFLIYRALRNVNPSPYMFHLRLNGFDLIGSSPELLAAKEGDRALLRPIAGTRPRGKTEEQDLQLEKELLADPKEKAEHIMLVDLARNDLGRVCQFGSVKVTDLMRIERYSHVMHIVSDVEGKLSPEYDAFDLFAASFPAGTVSGAPKIRAMEIIEELESSRRGPYAGAVGFFGFEGNMEMAITIRTILLKDKVAYVQAGAGIVSDSQPLKEYQESKNKAAALWKAIDFAESMKLK
ncbi:MAG: anthranilate synthase component I [Elusimicrobiota bacterium]